MLSVSLDCLFLMLSVSLDCLFWMLSVSLNCLFLMLSVSLDCLFLNSPSVFSNVYYLCGLKSKMTVLAEHILR